MSEDMRYEKSLKIYLSLMDTIILGPGKFTDHETNVNKKSFRKNT